MLFAAGAAVIALLTGAALAMSRTEHFNAEAARLEAVADLRAGQVSQWLLQRSAQVQYGADGALGEAVAHWLDAGGAATHEGLVAGLGGLQKASPGHGAMVVDRQGEIIAAVGKHVDFTAELADVAARAFAQNSVAFSAPYPDVEGRERYLDIAAPLAQSGDPARAVLVLRMNAGDFLATTLGRWPLPTRSAASMLLAADGTPLIWPATAPVPLTGRLRGGGDPVFTRDARGHDVLAVARPVASAGWLLVAKIDEDEAYAEANRDEFGIAGFGAALLFVWAIGLYLMRERQAYELKDAQARQQAGKLQALQLLQSIADTSTDAIYAKDQDGRFLLFNREAGRAAGMPPDAVLGQRECDIYPPAQAARMRAADRGVIESGQVATYENEVDTVDGTVTYLTTKGPLRDPDGQVIGVFGISRDISARLRAEAKLRESAQLTRAVGNSVVDQLAVLDPQGCVIRTNDAWRGAAGRTHDGGCEALPSCGTGMNYLDEVARRGTASGRRALEGIESVLRGREALFMFEYNCVCEPGAPQWFVMKVTPLRTARGGVVVVHSDITQLKRVTAELGRYRDHLENLVEERTAQLAQTNQALVESERFVTSMTDNMPAALAYWDRDLRCAFANRRFRSTYGVQREAALELSLPQVIGASRFGEIEPRVRNVLQGHACSYQTGISAGLPGAGQQFHVSLIPDTVGGEVRGFFMLGLDVTELRHAQEQLQRAHDELVVARDRAEGASRAKSAFLANMSHEIRTPMNAIIGFADLLKADCTDPEAHQRLEQVIEAAHHLLALINDILDLSKIESGKFTLECTDFSLADAVRRAVMLVAPQAQAKELGLSVDLAGVPDGVRGDPTRFAQAVLNLVGNAVKFTQEGRVSLRAMVLEETQAGLLVRLEVRDTGIGIARDKLAGLFAAFEQADSSTTRRFGGTGLGLALTRHIAELMGGETGVESEPGRGSLFWFTARLLRAERDIEAAAPHAAAPGVQPVAAGPLPAAHILLVEDNRFNQEVAMAVLKRAGLDVALAPDGQRALDMARAVRYDLVLMDLQMPVMDGFESTVALRRLPGYEATPILALTANAFGETRSACLAAGMNDHIAKPITPQRLCEALARWLPQVAAAAAPPPPPANADIVMRLAGIEGFDPSAGLAVTGDEQAYIGLLRRFVAAHEDGVPGLDTCLATGQAEQARRMVHSLKGSAAALGAQALREQAAACEATIARRDGLVQARLMAFDLEYELVHFVGALHDRLALSQPGDEAFPGEGMDGPQLDEALETLGYLLASGDFGAQRFHREIAAQLRQAFGGPADALAQAVREHDYERAFALLETLGPGARIKGEMS